MTLGEILPTDADPNLLKTTLGPDYGSKPVDIDLLHEVMQSEKKLRQCTERFNQEGAYDERMVKTLETVVQALREQLMAF